MIEEIECEVPSIYNHLQPSTTKRDVDSRLEPFRPVFSKQSKEIN